MIDKVAQGISINNLWRSASARVAFKRWRNSRLRAKWLNQTSWSTRACWSSIRRRRALAELRSVLVSLGSLGREHPIFLEITPTGRLSQTSRGIKHQEGKKESTIIISKRICLCSSRKHPASSRTAASISGSLSPQTQWMSSPVTSHFSWSTLSSSRVTIKKDQITKLSPLHKTSKSTRWL